MTLAAHMQDVVGTVQPLRVPGTGGADVRAGNEPGVACGSLAVYALPGADGAEDA